jgi:hypothetical protein
VRVLVICGLTLSVLIGFSSALQARTQTEGEKFVHQEALRCFSALTARQFDVALRCIDKKALEEVRHRYLKQRVLPNYKRVPLELQLAFGREVTKEHLKNMEPVALLSGALAGTVRALEIGSYRMRNIHFTVRKTLHRIQEVYEVRIAASADVVGGRQYKRYTLQYVVLAHFVDGSVRFQVPQFILDLVGPTPRQHFVQ